ncbi:hypothetical protein JYU34_021501 [Plutella xylostella]|uniref:Uncharacterized protein n=2 Tax=Plutella xylostella TaxID=51655 RepID=A0ABQ7PTQ5_PLUXY|nr:MAPK regulated corepressor interacting protein 2 [Plutella xylostella]KAG7296362.1 hypothetical protein JYU34_021501 [Plutella xylostella]CAG9087209.1 unnamed protein product [Plutella xylostella]
MDRNMRSSYVNSGPRSLPHMGSKRHSDSRGPRLSPPAQAPNNINAHNNNSHSTQHDDLINYIYDSWSKVNRDLERGNDEAKYYQDMVSPRQLANFRPFNLEEWWARKLLQTINRNKHRS